MMGRIAFFLAYSECSEWHVRLQISGRIKTQSAGVSSCKTATHFFSWPLSITHIPIRRLDAPFPCGGPGCTCLRWHAQRVTMDTLP